MNWEERVIRQYNEMFDAYIEQRGLIPTGDFHEMRYDALVSDPIGQMRSAYAALGLPDFAHTEPALRAYVATLAGYQKNVLPEITPDVRARIAAEWGRAFDEFGYPR